MPPKQTTGEDLPLPGQEEPLWAQLIGADPVLPLGGTAQLQATPASPTPDAASGLAGDSTPHAGELAPALQRPDMAPDAGPANVPPGIPDAALRPPTPTGTATQDPPVAYAPEGEARVAA